MKRLLFALGALLIFSAGFLPIIHAAPSSRPEIIGAAPGASELQISPDGRWLLAHSSRRGDLISPQREVRLFDTTKRTLSRQFDAAFTEFSLDSQRLVSFDSKRRELQITRLPGGEIEQRWTGLTLQPFETVDDVQFQRGGRELVAVTPFRIWRLNVASGAKISQIKIRVQRSENPHGYNAAFLLKDGRRLLYLNGDEAHIYDARAGKRVGKAELGLLSPDEKWQWSYNPEVGQFWMGDFSTGETLWNAEFYDQPQFSGDGKSLIEVGEKTGVRLLAPRTGKLIRKLDVPTPKSDDGVNPTYALSPDNNFWFERRGAKITRYRVRWKNARQPPLMRCLPR